MAVRKSAVPISVPNPATTATPPFRSRHALRIPDAAIYIGATPFYVEELIRAGELPFREYSKYRTLDADDLDAWIQRQPKVRVLKIENGKAVTERAA
jgi:hypothetical protein